MKALFAVIVGLAMAAPAVADSPTSRRLTDQDRTFYASSVAFSPDSALLASADRSVLLWQLSALAPPPELDPSVTDDDPSTWKQQATLQGNGSGVQTVAFSPDGITLASGAEDGTVLLWRSFSK